MTSQTPARQSITVESKPSALDGLGQKILGRLKASGYSPDDVFAVHLALEEAFLNAVKHGNKLDSTKTVQVDFAIDTEKVEISVTDQGVGFDPGKVPDPRMGDNLLRTEGRGILLMNSYMNIVKYSTRGNQVTMVRFRQRPGLSHDPTRQGGAHHI